MDYQIQTEFQGPGFVAVPNAVAQSPALSAEALGVLVYLASQPRGFLARVAVIQDRFNMGKDRWQRIARELREAGAMELQTVRGPGGRVVGKRMVVRWPDFPGSETSAATESRETRPLDRKPEKPAVGKPAKVSRKTRQSEPENPAPYKEQKITKARRRAARPCEGPAATVALGAAPGPEGQAQAQAAQAGAGRPDPWTRASQAAALGLSWVDPASGVWRAASEFPDAAQASSGAPVAGSG